MNCSYCGKEMKDHWTFCMYCGTKVDDQGVMEADFAPPAYDLWEPKAQVTAPAVQEAPAQVEAYPQPRKITIDPEKFEYHPTQWDEPVPKGVSSWELVPANVGAPKIVLPTRRGLGKMIFLGLLTLGIYPLVIYSSIVTELNIAASRYDGKRTMTFFGMTMLAPLTLGIYAYVWYHNLCARIGDELQRRGVDYKFGPSHFWLWGILGSFILVGPFIFTHKLMKSMNLLNKNFNEKG